MAKWYKVVIETQGFDAVGVYAEDENEAEQIAYDAVRYGDYNPTDDDPNFYCRAEEGVEDELRYLFRFNKEGELVE